MDRVRFEQIFEAARANVAALNGCAGPHDLVEVAPDGRPGRRYRCRACGGELEAVHKFFYEQGLRHGRGP